MNTKEIYETLMEYLFECDPRNDKQVIKDSYTKLRDYLNRTNLDGFDWSFQSEGIRKPIIYEAASNGLTDIVDFIISKGGDTEAKNYSGGTALSMAIEYGYYETAELLLKRGANVNAVNSRNISPLYKATIMGRLDLVKLLLSYGADVTLESRGQFYGETPISAAIRLGYKDILELLSISS